MRAAEGEVGLCHVSMIAYSLPSDWNHSGHIPSILNAGLPRGVDPFEAAAREAFPALALDAVEPALAAPSAADALDLSDIFYNMRNELGGGSLQKVH